jgi:hypothetical protein
VVPDGIRVPLVWNCDGESTAARPFPCTRCADANLSQHQGAVESSGYSYWATPRSPKEWEGLVRIDRLTTNQALDESKVRTIVGGAYWVPLAGGVSTAFLLDYERVTYKGVVPLLPTEQRIALHVLVSF